MLFLFLACSQPESDTGDVFYPPNEMGPYTAATTSQSFTHSMGFEIPVQVWYPSAQSTGMLHQYGDLMAGNALQDLPITCDNPLPVVLFSHGNQGLRYQSHFLTEYLATHGYIVVAPDHVGNTFMDYEADRMTEVTFRRPLDIQESYDWLINESKYADCIDTTTGYSVVGHSFGGYTTLALLGAEIDSERTAAFCTGSHAGDWLCNEVAEFAQINGAGIFDLSDPRITKGVALTPAGYEALIGGLETIDLPVYVMGGSTDTTTSMNYAVKPIFSAIGSADKYLAELQGANHYTFTNACDLVATDLYCNPNGIDMTQAHQIINTSITAFLGLDFTNASNAESEMADYFPLQNDLLIWNP